MAIRRWATLSIPFSPLPQPLHPMATLQAITPLLAVDPPSLRLGRTADEEEGLVIAARLPAAIAAIHAALRDHPEHTYPQSRRYGSRYLQLINGRPPTAEQIQAFECTQILQLEMASTRARSPRGW